MRLTGRSSRCRPRVMSTFSSRERDGPNHWTLRVPTAASLVGPSETVWRCPIGGVTTQRSPARGGAVAPRLRLPCRAAD